MQAKHPLVVMSTISFVLIIPAILSSCGKPREYVAGIAKEEVKVVADQTKADLEAQRKDFEAKMADQVAKHEKEREILAKKASETSSFFTTVLYLLGLIALIRVLGTPLLRVVQMTLLKFFAPRPRKILK